MRDARPSQVERHAPGEGGGKVVGVVLEPEPQGQQLVEGRLRRCGCQPERDRGCRRAEPALEWDPVEESKPLARRVGEKRVRPDREIRAVLGELALALALDDDSLAGRHVELVPQLEGDRRAVEPRAQVGGGCGCANVHATAQRLSAAAALRIESGVGSHSTGAGA